MRGWNVPKGFKFDKWTVANPQYGYYQDPQPKPGVYLIICKEWMDEPTDDFNIKVKILFIGHSRNLFNKFSRSHSVYPKLKRELSHLGGVDFYFKHTDNFLIESKKLIKKFNPEFNKSIGRKKRNILPQQKISKETSN